MLGNEFGHLFKVTSFGESHGKAMGVVIQGCPSGVEFLPDVLESFLARRRPNQNPWVTSRNEADNYEILSGVFEGKTLGTPIAVVVYNQDTRSKDYDKIKNQARPGHADDVWKLKYSHVDHRGGGRSSGRETLSRVIAGAFAKMYLQSANINTEVTTKITKLGPLENKGNDTFPEGTKQLLTEAKEQGESYGGHIHLNISNVSPALGEPVFKKLKAQLATAYMSVGAVVGVELTGGFKNTLKKGTEFHKQGEVIYQGIRGGISTGENINLTIAMKPTSSILDTAKQGRHDPCILVRALPVFEAMTYLVLADTELIKKLNNI